MDGGDPGPGRRLRGEGLGPESTSGLSPPPGFRTTGVGVPRPRPPPHTHPGACSPEATSGPRPRPRSRGRRRRGLPAAARFGSASPPPPPDTKPVRGPARPRGPSSPPRAPEGGFAGRGGTTEAARLFLLLLLALLPLLSPLSPRPRREARKRSGGGEGFAGFPLYYFFVLPPPRPRPLSGPHPAPTTPPRQALWRTRPGFGRAPPLRGLLSRDCTGRAREAGLGRAPIGGPGAGPSRHKVHRPAHVTPRFVTTAWNLRLRGEQEKLRGSADRGRRTVPLDGSGRGAQAAEAPKCGGMNS